MPCKMYKFRVIFVFFFTFPTISNAQMTEALLEDMPVQTPKAATKIARARIPIELTSYNKLLLRNQEGVLEEVFRPQKPKRAWLRSRIERKNHFYLSNWHIETVPMEFVQAEKYFLVKLRFYRMYGKNKGLEEYVGMVEVAGYLDGKDYLYRLKTFQNHSFTNKAGDPLLDVVVGLKSDRISSVGLKDRAKR